MKKITVLFMLLVFSAISFSQKPILTKDEYLVKSKKQKGTAWGLLGGGAGLLLIAELVGNGKNASFDDAGTGVVLGGIGVCLMIVSIPTFMASAKNKRKGMALAFKNEMVPFPKNGSFVNSSCPSLAIKIRF